MLPLLERVLHSPVIDAGDLLTVFTNEPLPNGNRVNMGAYGHTDEASMARLDKSLTAVTANDGGVLRGTNVTIRWLSSSTNLADTLSLEYSPDAGITWTTVVSGLPITTNEYIWDITQSEQSLSALYRLILDSDTNVFDAIDNAISLRTNTLAFYVNDTNTIDDVFTTVPGSGGNDGLSSNTPKLTVAGILNTYDLEGGDTIYVDHGQYQLSSETVWIWSNGGGELGSNVTLSGVGRDTVFDRGSVSSNNNAFLVYGDNVTIRELTVASAGAGILIKSNELNRVERAYMTSNLVAVAVRQSSDTFIEQSLFIQNSGAGVAVEVSANTTIEK